MNIFDFQDPSEDQEVAVMAKWPTVPNFFLALIEKKTKIPKKLQNTKRKNIVKILLSICMRQYPVHYGQQFLIFFKNSLWEREKKTKHFKKITKYKIQKYC